MEIRITVFDLTAWSCTFVRDLITNQELTHISPTKHKAHDDSPVILKQTHN